MTVADERTRDLGRLAGFLVAVVAVFGVAFGVGRAVGPVGAASVPPSGPAPVTTSTTVSHDHAPPSAPTTGEPGGSGSHGSHPASATSVPLSASTSTARPGESR